MDKDFKPEICLFAYFDNKTSFAANEEIYDEYMLFSVEKGSFRYKIGNNEWHIAKENSIVVCPPGVSFSKEVLEPLSLIVAKLRLQPDFIISQEPFTDESLRIAENISVLTQNGFAYTHCPDEKTCHYIMDLWHTFSQGSQRRPTPLQDAYDYICNHFCEDISIQDLAQSHGYTPPRFIALFNKYYGAPPKNIILQHRILKAQQLLLQTDLSVGEISLKCGYEDTLYFSRIFSKYCGVSPSQFRKTENI